LRQLSSVFGSGIALSAALLAGACQHDSTADFDDTHLSSGSSGATSSGGSTAEPGAGGANDAGSPGSGGSSAVAGSSAMGGESGSGAGGTGTGGKGGGTAGKGGQAMGGSEPGGTNGGGNAGKGGTETAGTGGTNPIPDPDPVTIQVHEFDDATISSCDQNENFGNQNILQTDGDLCRFDALINPALNAIPASATISQATLSLLCVNPGGTVTVSLATGKKWTESMVRWSTRPEVGELIEEVSCQKDGDVVSIDLTDAVKAWLAGTAEADGIFLRTVDTDGTDFASSEAGKEADRPVLEVTYTPAKK
jgi:hypothetical protein